MTYTVSAELPPEIKAALQRYLDDHPDWSVDRTIVCALSLFLLQNGTTPQDAGRTHRDAARVYLETLFNRPHP